MLHITNRLGAELDENTKKAEESWLHEKVKNMKPEEEKRFLADCGFFLAHVTEYSQNPEKEENSYSF